MLIPVRVLSGIGSGCCGGAFLTDLWRLLRVGRFLDLVSGGAPGHGPVHLLVESAASLGFQWSLGGFCWDRPGLPHLPMIEGPYQHFLRIPS